MKRAILKISDSYLMQLLSTIKSSYSGIYSVIKNPLPKDTKIVRVSYDDNSTLILLLESEEFAFIEEGWLYPILPAPIMQMQIVQNPAIVPAEETGM